MIDNRRLLAVGGVLALAAAALAGSHAFGGPGQGLEGKDRLASTGSQKPEPVADRRFSEELVSRFVGQPVITYQTRGGDTLFGLQVQPKLPAGEARPRDVLVLIDTSASQSRSILRGAIKTAEQIVSKLGADDRVAIWTANVETRSLTKGFKAPTELKAAFKDLAEEFPAGAVNLKKGLSEAANAFDIERGRQRVIVFLGDGMSIAGPLDGADRVAACSELAEKEIAFYPVPLGPQLDPINLHGLAGGTGGKAIRVLGDFPEQVAAKLVEAFAVPVLYPRSGGFKLGDSVVEAFPTKLPPLRADSPTLVVGKLKAGADSLSYTVKGDLLDKPVTHEVKEMLPEAELENFFLISVVSQWRDQKDAPALVRADRALAHAENQHVVARNELILKAGWAVQEDRFDVAVKLFDQAEQLDPTSAEARAGKGLVQKMRDGKMTRAQIQEQLKPKAGDVARIDQGKIFRVQLPEGPERRDEPVDPNLPKPDLDPNQLARDIEARRAVADQRAIQVINDAIRQASALVQSDPEGAQELLKRTRDGVLTNPDLSPRVQASLAAQIDRSLQRVVGTGRLVRKAQEERLAALAVTDALNAQRRLEEAAQDRVRERLRVFHNLMNQAREQEAQKQAEAIRRDLIDQGLPVPQAVLAAYVVGQRGHYFRQEREFERKRNENWLAVMLEVERSHMPFPDEPPIRYPDPDFIKRITGGRFKDWAEYSDFRKKQYETSGFDSGQVPLRTLEIRDSLAKQVKYGGQDLPTATLGEELDRLATRYNLTFDVDEKAFIAENLPEFKQAGDVLKFPIAEKAPLSPMNASLSTVLRKVLSRLPSTSGATFLIRRDTIEITTNQAATAEKVIRIYPVADLVFQPPSAFNQQSIQNQATLFGAAGSYGLTQQFIMQGFGNQFGNPFNNFGQNFGMGGNNAGQNFGNNFGQFGMMFGNQGMFGNAGMQFGMQFGQFGQVGQQGVQGQFGNLGGQFGIQGGNFSDQLVVIIRQLVGTPKDWAAPYTLPGNMPADPTADPNANPDGGQIGFYPPAMALVVKATSRIHTSLSPPTVGGGGLQPLGALDRNDKNDRVVRIGPGVDRDKELRPNIKIPDVKLAGAGAIKPAERLDPRTVWQDALEKGVENPAIIIAVADFLAINGYWDHAAEFLKANLRQGIRAEPWVYESLAVALKQSGGSPLDIERAQVSAADLNPQDTAGYLKASKALAEGKRYARAVALCKQAALLEPSLPNAYADGLVYAELADDVQGVEWAAGNLLKQDWPVDNKGLQTKAHNALASAAGKLDAKAKQQLLDSVNSQRQRDIVIKLVYQGDADLDLRVKEPAGSTCSVINRQSVGGGVFIGDALSDKVEDQGETYLAAEAFSGEYTVTVEKVWGSVTGNRATLKVIRNQGTRDEHEEIIPVDLKSSQPIKVKLDKGRRTEMAYVPPPSAQTQTVSAGAREETLKVMSQLRHIASPEILGVGRAQGGVGGVGAPVLAEPVKPAKPNPKDEVLYQSRVQSFVKNTMDVTQQVVLSADRRQVRVSYSPAFDTINRSDKPPVVTSSVIPGGR